SLLRWSDERALRLPSRRPKAGSVSHFNRAPLQVRIGGTPMATTDRFEAAQSPVADGGIDAFIPTFDIRERHTVEINAPPSIVFDVACNLDMQSIPLVRAIFWLRSKLLRSVVMERKATGLVREMKGIGWGVLTLEPDRLIVMGATTQPWQP